MNEQRFPDIELVQRLRLLTDPALASLELEEMLTELLRRTRDVLGADTCAVLLMDEGGQELVARAAVGIEEEVRQEVRIPVGRGFAGRIAAERRAIVLDDVEHADVLNPILRQRGIKSLLGVPLIVRGEVTGVLHVGTLTPRVFTDEHTELLRLAGERIAVGLEQTRLIAAERSARERTERLQAVTDLALAHLELNELLAVLLPRIREILKADTCAVLLMDEGGQELVARAAVGIEEEVRQEVRIPVGRGFAGRIAAERRAIVLDDVEHADVLNPILRQRGIKSLLGVPLIVRGEVTGVLHVGMLSPYKFSADEVELLRLVGDRVAMAVERAVLHAETVELQELEANFVAIASHELRTPATSVYGVLATLAARLDLPTETREQLVQVGHAQAERLRVLIEQLLDLSQLDARRRSAHPRPIPVAQTLADIVSAVVPDGTRVQLEVSHDLTACADPLVIDRVVSNLLINATRHGRPPIVLSAVLSGSELQIAVEDCGPGVPDELRSHLFERFARGESAQGSGLGLTIARAYARAHGGDLSLAPGVRGARFELTVPLP